MKICKKGLHEFEGKHCKECQRANMKVWHEKNKEEAKAYYKVYNEVNKGQIKVNNKVYYSMNKEKVKVNHKTYYITNKEQLQVTSKAWRKANPDKCNANNTKRRAKKLNATPSWLTKEQLVEITAFYKKAKELEKETGVPHHVDHIVPLQGRVVSGLHVPWNLQVITATENLEKGNRYEAP